MSKRLFGTDGVRGVANLDLTPELAFQIGQAAASLLCDTDESRSVAIGMDTRLSGSMLLASLAAGFASLGVDARVLGVVPTGCVSYVARTGDFGLAAVISASHNPAPDNGIKLLAGDGKKVSDAFELELETRLGKKPNHRPTEAGVGRISLCDGEIGGYVEMLLAIVPEGLEGMTVAVDAANGAAYELGPEVLRTLGAKVIEIGVSPDGMNINADCGATRPTTIQQLCKAENIGIGVAFDGDADRAVFSDSKGRLINGDRAIGIYCEHWRNSLEPKVAVGTVMSNGGFERHLKSIGFRLERAEVGDRYVSLRIKETGAPIGGEQSGHIIFKDRGPTGDGLITALELLRILKREGREAADFVDAYEPYPQVLVNVRLEFKDGWKTDERIQEAVSESHSRLEGRGRVSVRASGTQPIARIMVEADERSLRDSCADRIVGAFTEFQGGSIYSRVDLTYALGD